MTSAPQVGLFGKHPGLGDFFSRGLEAAVKTTFDDWLTEALFAAKEQLAEDWADVFDGARPIRFWIGAAVVAPTGLAGVMVPSRDKAGRRFPLAAVAPEPPRGPPSLTPDQAWYRQLEAQLLSICSDPSLTADDMRDVIQEGVDRGAPAPAVPASGQFWAFNGELSADALWEQAMKEDLRRASRSRSYLWVESAEQRASAVLACDGLPNGRAVAWALSTDVV